MRRLTPLLTALVLLGALVPGAMLVAHPHRLAAIAHGAARALAEATSCIVPVAGAQEVLEFKPVPPESASRNERRRRARATAAPAPVPPVPSVPAIPPVPSTPPTRSGDLMRVGADIEVGEDQIVTGDVLAMGGDVTVLGRVEGNVVAMGGDVYLESTARVKGDVVCVGGELHEEPGAQVSGQRVTAMGPFRGGGWGGGFRAPLHSFFFRGAAAFSALMWLLVLMAIAWGLTRLAPGSSRAALESFKSRTALSLGLGFLVMILVAPSVVALALVVALLCITIIGIPLAIAALLGYSLFLALLAVWGYVVGAAALGEWVVTRRRGVAPAIGEAAVWGVAILGGARLIGKLLRWTDLPFFGGLGGALAALATICGLFLAVMGAGAWLHAEFTTGTLGRWWRGPRFGRVSPAAAAPAPTPAVPGPQAAPPAPPAPTT